LYQATATAIRREITSGKLAPGDQVGSSLKSLARHHSTGIGTMRAALAVLSSEGLVETIPGKGTYVLATVEDAAAVESHVQELAKQVAELRDEVHDLDVRVMEIYSRLSSC